MSEGYEVPLSYRGDRLHRPPCNKKSSFFRLATNTLNNVRNNTHQKDFFPRKKERTTEHNRTGAKKGQITFSLDWGDAQKVLLDIMRSDFLNATEGNRDCQKKDIKTRMDE